MKVGEIYNTSADPEYRIELKAPGCVYVLPLDEAERFAREILQAITQFRQTTAAPDLCRECREKFGHPDNCIGCPLARLLSDDYNAPSDHDSRDPSLDRATQSPMNDAQRFAFIHQCIKEWYGQEPPYETERIEFITYCLRKWEERLTADRASSHD